MTPPRDGNVRTFFELDIHVPLVVNLQGPTRRRGQERGGQAEGLRRRFNIFRRFPPFPLSGPRNPTDENETIGIPTVHNDPAKRSSRPIVTPLPRMQSPDIQITVFVLPCRQFSPWFPGHPQSCSKEAPSWILTVAKDLGKRNFFQGDEEAQPPIASSVATHSAACRDGGKT